MTELTEERIHSITMHRRTSPDRGSAQRRITRNSLPPSADDSVNVVRDLRIDWPKFEARPAISLHVAV